MTAAVPVVAPGPDAPGPTLVERLLSPESGLRMFALALLLAYALIPAVVYAAILPERVFAQLAMITTVGVVAMIVGGKLPIADLRLASNAHWLNIDWRAFVGLSWVLFAAFVAITFATAPSIPIISAFRGVTDAALGVERGEFLKGRSGAGLALLYISAFMVNTIVPYSVVVAYAARSRARHWLAAGFFLFTISFMVKSLFLHLALPLLAFFAMRRQLGGLRALAGFGACVAVLVAASFLAIGSDGSAAVGEAVVAAEVLSSAFAPSNPIEYFVWRAVAVPIFTATDTLVVHATYFDARPLWGATSSFLASLLGFERINLERFVFEFQYGAWNELANSNTMFLLDGYVNFGWFGVVAFGMFVGQVFRWFRLSRDVGFRALWPLFAFVLFNAPLIGLMLGSGFLYMLAHALTIRMRGLPPPVT